MHSSVDYPNYAPQYTCIKFDQWVQNTLIKHTSLNKYNNHMAGLDIVNVQIFGGCKFHKINFVEDSAFVKF